MRVTQDVKKATRSEILAAARRLFRSNGFDQATTRDIAREAGIAVGTLFNYFATKEAIVLTLVSVALDKADSEFDKKRRRTASLEEDLFLHIAVELRQLKPFRKFLRPVIESTFTPVVKSSGNEASETIRIEHLEIVERLLMQHGHSDPCSPMTLHLYWTLYTGVLTSWCEDRSPKQEDTLALLDQSLKMFVGWLRSDECDINFKEE